MINVQSILVCLFSGGISSGAWFFLIDGIVQSHVNGGAASAPPFMWFYVLPAIFVTLTNVCMNFVEKKQLQSLNSSSFGDSGNKKATAWFIFMLAGSMCCIGGKARAGARFTYF